MCAIKQTANRREALTLIELLVVIAIILAIAALAAAFAPRVSENTNLTRAIDQMEQWLLTAKMRAKRDGLATGIRFVPTPADATTPGVCSQFQYIQQPDPLSGGWTSATGLNGGMLVSASGGTVTFQGVDFSLGGAVLAQGLVQAGDYLELRDGGVYLIGSVPSPTTLQLATVYGQALNIGPSTTPPSGPTVNYRILRQPRILVGETPLEMPNNYVVDFNAVPGTNPPVPGTNVANGSSGAAEILFSPTGAVVGANAGNAKVFLFIHDVTMNPFDINKTGLVGIQSRTGFIGAYSVAPGADPFVYAELGRGSGL